MYCGNCGQKLADHLQYCTRCGRPVEPASRPKKKKRRLLPFVLAFLLSATLTYGLQTGRLSLKPASSRLPSVPAELRSHAFLRSRDQGPCGKLEGDVGILLIFVDDADSSWTQEAMDAYLSEVDADVQGMTHDAAIWGRELSVRVETRQGSVAGSLSSTNVDAHVESMLLSAGVEGGNEVLEKVLGVDHAPVVFVVNKPGRASAQMGTGGEYCFLFDDGSAFRHELFHLFGAEDLYYPEEVTAIAERCFTESIMLGYDSDTVDDLTAYLIGWTNSLSESALSFLEQTTYVTEESLRSAFEEEAYTGYGTKRYDDSTYTGELHMGIPNGWGTMVMDDGDSFEGQFVSGVRSGTGTYRWSNGDVYQGGFVEDIRSGFGTFTWSSGDCYEGNFEEDLRTGWGIYTWADGTRYEGEFLKDEITGTGTFYWTDGSRYYGEFLNGMLHGQGTLTYANGESISGVWHNNEYLG